MSNAIYKPSLDGSLTLTSCQEDVPEIPAPSVPKIYSGRLQFPVVRLTIV